MAKKFFYKGKTIEELQKMTVDEFIKVIPSKERRTLKRMGMQVKKFIEVFRKHKARAGGAVGAGSAGSAGAGGEKKPLRTHFRNMVILPEMVGSRIQVYNGNAFLDVNLVPEMLGHRLGEYSITIKQVRHSGPGIGATRGSKAVELK